MAKVVFVGLEKSTSNQIRRALQGERHKFANKPDSCAVRDILDADIVFANASGENCLNLLREIRFEKPALSFVVVTGRYETAEWLDALDAGATDYCSTPFESKQISWVMESALRKPQVMAA